MPDISTQRTIVKRLGDRLDLEFAATIGHVIKPNSLFLEASGIGGAFERHDIVIGTPNLRTIWEIQSIALSMELELATFATVAKEPAATLFLRITLLAGNAPVDVTLIQVNYPETEGIFEAKIVDTVALKQYILELFGAANVGGGQQLSISLELIREKESHEPLARPSASLFIINPIATIIFNQTFHAPAN